VHWAPPGPDKPLTGIEVHSAFMEWASPELVHLFGRHEGPYWIDLFERSRALSRPEATRYQIVSSERALAPQTTCPAIDADARALISSHGPRTDPPGDVGAKAMTRIDGTQRGATAREHQSKHGQ